MVDGSEAAAPRVSVIIPAYNCGPYIDETIESVARQTVPAHEIVVVDDGSTDGTADALARYGSRIVCRRQKNSGVSAARNAGAELATGDWLLFLDGDDALLPNALADLTACAATGEFGVVFGTIVERDERTGECWHRGDDRSAGSPPVPARANFWKSAIVGPSAAIVRMDLHAACGGFDTTLRGAEDRDYWMRCGMLEAFGYCGTVVYEKRLRADSASRNLRRNLVGGVKVQVKFMEWCRERGLETRELGVQRDDILARALEKAAARNCCDAVPEIHETVAPDRRSGWLRIQWMILICRVRSLIVNTKR